MLELCLVLVSVLLLILAVQQLWTRKAHLRLSWQMPGPSLWFIVRNFPRLKKRFSSSGVLDLISDFTKIFKTPFRWWIGTTLYVCVNKPEHIQIFLNSPYCVNRAPLYDFLNNFAANGLLTLRTPKWKKHRKVLDPTFSLKILQSFVPIFNEEVNVLVSKLDGLCNSKEPTDIGIYMKALALDAVIRTTMGKQQNIQKLEYLNHFERTNISNIATKRLFNPFLHLNKIYRFTKLYREEKKPNVFLELFAKIVKDKKESWIKNHKESKVEDDSYTGARKPQIFIDQVMKLHMIEKEFTEEDVMGEVNSIIIAGYKTTGLTAAYSVLMLAMFPDYQERIFEEVKSIMPDKFDSVQYEDLNKYAFLDRFIKEILRLFPIITLIIRNVTGSIKLGEYTIPPETNIMCPVFHLHRDKELWGPNADNFDPDHFLPENIKKLHPYAYLPFGGGPRNCIGMKYSAIFQKIIVIQLVRNFKFRTDLKLNDLRFYINLPLNILNKHMVYLEKRNDGE